MRSFGFRSTFKSMFDVKTWISWKSIARNGRVIKESYATVFAKPKQSTPESFEEAVKKYGYNDGFLIKQKERFLQASRIYLAFFVAAIIYTVWLVVYKYYVSSLLMLPFSFMLFSFYFRESFWYMQIHHRRLGMTMKDWFKFTVLDNG